MVSTPVRNDERSSIKSFSELSRFSRLDCPTVLHPQNSTFLDIALHAKYMQRLSTSTIEKRLRYARFMENHRMPVDFRKPNYENFRRHMDYREEIENVSSYVLIQEWKTMRMFLKAFGIPCWDYKPPHAPAHRRRILPFPDVVNRFFNYEYSKDRYENALYQYLFCHGFLIGWRVPSEIIEMKVDDIIIDSNGRGSITITETKKHRNKRTILPEKHILSSQSHKSFKNWIDHWRPKVVNQYSGDSLYLQPSGKPFTVRHLGHRLSRHGQKIWSSFQPYDMRHWCAVARLIETKIQTKRFEPYTVRNWLGHTSIKTTEVYIQHAEQYYSQCKGSWIKRALRTSKDEKQESLHSYGLTRN